MEFLELMQQRYAVRNFDTKQVEQEKPDKILRRIQNLHQSIFQDFLLKKPLQSYKQTKTTAESVLLWFVFWNKTGYNGIVYRRG